MKSLKDFHKLLKPRMPQLNFYRNCILGTENLSLFLSECVTIIIMKPASDETLHCLAID